MSVICLSSFILISCTQTKIICTDTKAEIYMDGRFIGQGDAEVPRVGLPASADLEAKRRGKVIGRTTISRKFTMSTLLSGVFTYGTGLFFCWYYPDTVIIPVTNTNGEIWQGKNPWDYPRESIWMKPMHSGK